MTTFKVVVEDEQAGLLKKLLEQVSFVKSIEEASIDNEHQETESTLERIKKIQQDIGNKTLFKDIKDPVEWQREIRKEWDRDL